MWNGLVACYKNGYYTLQLVYLFGQRTYGRTPLVLHTVDGAVLLVLELLEESLSVSLTGQSIDMSFQGVFPGKALVAQGADVRRNFEMDLLVPLEV